MGKTKILFIYHQIPNKIKGDVLYPLNEIKKIYPEIYRQGIEKYKNRKKIMKSKILPLDCLWNDALHFNPIDPRLIKKSLAKFGYKFSGEFFRIHWEKLDPKITTIYKNTSPRRIFKKDFEDYNLENLVKYKKIPATTMKYYEKLIKQGKKPLIYSRIPHIFYRGSMNIKNTPIIKV
ncbi:MAG: hypothetical protein WC610_03700 [Patescibacteria group bacterium]